MRRQNFFRFIFDLFFRLPATYCLTPSLLARCGRLLICLKINSIFFRKKFCRFIRVALPLRQKAARNKRAAETHAMYSVNYATRQVISGSDFFTKQAAQNALEDYARLNTTYGIDVDPNNFGVVSGGPYRDFLSAKNALVEFAIAVQAQVKGPAVMEAIAETFYLRALDARNPNEPTAFESMGFAPHQPLTAINLEA